MWREVHRLFFLRSGASVDTQRTFSNWAGRHTPIAHASLDCCASLLSRNSAFFQQVTVYKLIRKGGQDSELPSWQRVAIPQGRDTALDS